MAVAPVNHIEVSEQDSVKLKVVFLKNDSVYFQSFINGKVEHYEAGFYELANDEKTLVTKRQGQINDSMQLIDISKDTLRLRHTFSQSTVLLTR